MIGCKECLKDMARHPVASIALIVFIIFDLIMLIIGLWEMNGCPIDDNIPLYLIVAGGVGLGSKLLHIFNKKWGFFFIRWFCYLVFFFEFIWIIIGSYWVYKVFRPNFDPSAGPYCNKTAYYLSFWFITVHWILLGISSILSFYCSCPNLIKLFDWTESED